MELGESFEENAHREVYEETGLKVKRIQLLGTFSGKDTYYVYPNGDEVYSAVVIYQGFDPYGDMKVDEEGFELRYFSKEELGNLSLHPVSKKILQSFGWLS